VLLHELCEALVHGGLDERTDLGVAELRLRLALELRIAELDRHDRRQALAHVLTDERVVLLFEDALAARVRSDDARERATETFFVHTALVRVDVVREREDRLVERGRPLHRDLELVLVGLGLEVHDALRDRLAGRVEVLYEVDDPAGVAERLLLLRLDPLVDEPDLEALGQKRHLAQALRERVEAELALLGEDLRIRPEGHRGAGPLRVADGLEPCLRLAPGVLLMPQLAVADDVDLELLGQRVHYRDADAVEPSRHLVALALELAAGVKRGEHHLDGRLALALDRVHGDAAAVVGDAAATIGEELDLDLVAVPRHRLVHGVVDDLVDEVVESPDPGRPDVHPGAFPNGVEALEDRDVLRGVGPLGAGLRGRHRFLRRWH
jgi:hypothetical protein